MNTLCDQELPRKLPVEPGCSGALIHHVHFKGGHGRSKFVPSPGQQCITGVRRGRCGGRRRHRVATDRHDRAGRTVPEPQAGTRSYRACADVTGPDHRRDRRRVPRSLSRERTDCVPLRSRLEPSARCRRVVYQVAGRREVRKSNLDLGSMAKRWTRAFPAIAHPARGTLRVQRCSTVGRPPGPQPPARCRQHDVVYACGRRSRKDATQKRNRHRRDVGVQLGRRTEGRPDKWLANRRGRRGATRPGILPSTQSVRPARWEQLVASGIERRPGRTPETGEGAIQPRRRDPSSTGHRPGRNVCRMARHGQRTA